MHNITARVGGFPNKQHSRNLDCISYTALDSPKIHVYPLLFAFLLKCHISKSGFYTSWLQHLLITAILCVIAKEICKSVFLYCILYLALPLSPSRLLLILYHHFPKPRCFVSWRNCWAGLRQTWFQLIWGWIHRVFDLKLSFFPLCCGIK